MITPEQYQRLLPYKPYILNRTMDSSGGLITIYSEHGRHMDSPSCGACRESMFNFFQSILSDYERVNGRGE